MVLSTLIALTALSVGSSPGLGACFLSLAKSDLK